MQPQEAGQPEEVFGLKDDDYRDMYEEEADLVENEGEEEETADFSLQFEEKPKKRVKRPKVMRVQSAGVYTSH